MPKNTLLICPGIHETQLTESFLQTLKSKVELNKPLIFPSQNYPAFSAFHILHFLQQAPKQTQASSVLFLCFSAGVVGAIGAAWLWQQNGGEVAAFIALDGWGVPLYGNFPIYRLSHDEFSHWSSALLGGGKQSFYADPPVKHLDLWRSPDRAKGWVVTHVLGMPALASRTTAATFLATLLEKYLT
jgi:hypothetical protein